MAYKDKQSRQAVSQNAVQQKKADKGPLATNSKSVGKGIEHQPENQMALTKLNFIWMAVAGAMIIVGFLLMLGPSATVDHFEPDIFSTRRLVIGPLLAFLGFVAMAIAIIIDPSKRREKDERKENAEQTSVEATKII